MEERPVRIGDNVIFKDKLYKITEINDNKSIKISNKDNELVLQHEDYLNNKIKFISIFTGEQYIDMDILAFMDDSDLEIMCRFDNYIGDLCDNEDLWIIKLEPRYENILEYVNDNFKLKYRHLLEYGISEQSANNAAGNGYLDILKWLLKEHDILPRQVSVEWAAAGGYLKVLIWLEEKGILASDSEAANMAARNGHLDVLIWLKERNILPSGFYGINIAAANGHLYILIWLKENDILPNEIGADVAAGDGHLDVLIWLKENGILPGQFGANLAANNGYLHILKWLEKYGIFPDK